jgi:hypothetical protein
MGYGNIITNPNKLVSYDRWGIGTALDITQLYMWYFWEFFSESSYSTLYYNGLSGTDFSTIADSDYFVFSRPNAEVPYYIKARVKTAANYIEFSVGDSITPLDIIQTDSVDSPIYRCDLGVADRLPQDYTTCHFIEDKNMFIIIMSPFGSVSSLTRLIIGGMYTPYYIEPYPFMLIPTLVAGFAESSTAALPCGDYGSVYTYQGIYSRGDWRGVSVPHIHLEGSARGATFAGASSILSLDPLRVCAFTGIFGNDYWVGHNLLGEIPLVKVIPYGVGDNYVSKGHLVFSYQNEVSLALPWVSAEFPL